MIAYTGAGRLRGHKVGRVVLIDRSSICAVGAVSRRAAAN